MPRKAATKSRAPQSFEAAVQRLGEIVERLETDQVELDESLALFEEGVGLLREADGVLDAADTRVQQLLADGDGFRLADMDEPV